MKHDPAKLKTLYIDLDGDTHFGDYVITVAQDTFVESPREWDNMGTMVCWHRNYNLGDVDGAKEYGEFGSQSNFWIELAGIEDEGQELDMDKVMELAYKRNIILPLYLYDHSGITMNTTGFSCGWDSGCVGFIYVSLEQVRKEYSAKRVSKKLRARIEKYLTGEVETYDSYLTGDVRGFSIVRNDDDGDEIDVNSCWGYFGDDFTYMTDEIKTDIKYNIEHTPQQLNLI